MPFTSDAPLPAAILEHAIESVVTAVSITDPDDRILFVNRHFLELYGYAEEDLPALRVQDLRADRVPPELAGSILPGTLSGGWQGVLWQKRKDGSEFLVELATSPVRDGAGRTIALIGAARDITEERRLEARQECLYRISRLVQEVSAPERLYPALHEVVASRIDAPGFTLVLQLPPRGRRVAYDNDISGPLAAEKADVASLVIKEKRPFRLARAEWSALHAEGRLSQPAPKGLAWLGAPLLTEGQVIGAIVVRGRLNGFPYDDKDLELLEAIAAQVGQAIALKRIEEDRLSELSFKSALSVAVSNAGLGIVILQRGKVVYANGAAAAVTGYTTRELLETSSFLDVVHPDEREPMLRRLKRLSQTFLVGETYTTALLHREGRRVEVEVSVQPFALGQDRRYVATIHDITPLVLSARSDALTGLPNRHAVEDAFRREWERARRRSGALPPGLVPDRAVSASRPGALLSVLLVDIDRFSTFNEQHGPLAGDEMLRRTALVLRSALRAGDFLGRLSGKQLVVLLPETGLAGAVVTAERLRYAVEQDVFFDFAGANGEGEGQRLHVTVSVGAASVVDMKGVEPAQLLRRAHDALHEAKAAGRNRVAAAPLLGG